jgi:D-alanyl-D-alanine carboxypeptidase (penicillin-binding protein 5/6)
MFATIPRGQYKALDASMTIDSNILAPIAQGQSLGTVHVRLNDSIIAEQELVALHGINEGSFWQRIVDEALLYFE